MQNYGRLRNSFAEIHLGNLKHNYHVLRTLLGPGQGLFPMVKANAYGHGDVEISKVLSELGVDGLGVALIEEGIRLRLAGVTAPILVFSFFDSLGAEALVKFNLTPVLSQWDQIEKLKIHLSDGMYFPVHVKFNTGMARLGFRADEANRIRHELESQTQMRITGVCTHLLNAADSASGQGQSYQQLRTLVEIEKAFEGLSVQSHLLSSAALELGLKSSGLPIGARPGLAIYGVWPVQPAPKNLELRPVMSLKSHIAHVHQLKKGETVSYGAIWTSPGDSVVGVVPLGYADGYPRTLSNRGMMWCMGQRVKVCGTVCMDYTMVDLTGLQRNARALIGQEVTVFGRADQVGIDEVAGWAQTIPYEIMTGISSRVPRIFTH